MLSKHVKSLSEHLSELEPFRAPALPPRQAPTIYPSPALTGDPQGNTLSTTQIKNWHHQGFCLVDDVWPNELMRQAVTELTATALAPGMGQGKEFPSDLESLNEITLHPRLLRVIAQLLNTDESGIRLQESECWAKTSAVGGPPVDGWPALSNSDQRIHMDYPNMYLTHPPQWEAPESVELILYYSDVKTCGGPTHIVPRQGPGDWAYQWPYANMPGAGLHKFINDRTTAERFLRNKDPELYEFRKRLYEREVAVGYSLGTALIYRHDLWHRGTPLTTEREVTRHIHSLSFRKAQSEYCTPWSSGLARALYGRGEAILTRASITQRCVLGFPAPGHPYWNPDTIEAVKARYPGKMDMRPYEDALSEKVP